MKARRENRRTGEQRKEDRNARLDGNLVDESRTQREQQAPRVDEQDRLTLVIPLLDEAVVDVALVRLTNAHVRALATDDGGEVSRMGTPATMSG